MKNNQGRFRIFIFLTGLIIFVMGASHFSNTLWGGKPEKIEPHQNIIFSPQMTIKAFGEKNQLPNPVLKKIFNLTSREDFKKTLGAFPMNEAQLTKKINQALAIQSEEGSKNWIKIRIKFISWFIFLAIAFVMTRKKKITPFTRKILYFASITIFGVILGSDPGAMGTIKDAIALYGAKGVIFPPRMIALTVFLALVFIANKFFCSWGCQLGTLQDLIFRFNRSKKDTKGLFKQYKPSFKVTNTIRISFFAVFTAIAMVWAVDIVEPIDPFKVYKLSALSYLGWAFIAIVLIASLFVYRPWCSLFCPFGLVGWLVEKISIFKIKVDYNRCVACGTCTVVCPNTSMAGILKQDRVIPDCFACSTCIDACPEDAISFASGKRNRPDKNKFKKLS